MKIALRAAAAPKVPPRNVTRPLPIALLRQVNGSCWPAVPQRTLSHLSNGELKAAPDADAECAESSDAGDNGHDVRSFTAAITKLGKAGKWEEALALFEAGQEGVEPDIFTYAAAIRACHTGQQQESALEVLDVMTEQIVKPSRKLSRVASGISADVINGQLKWLDSISPKAIVKEAATLALQPPQTVETLLRFGHAIAARSWDLRRGGGRKAAHLLTRAAIRAGRIDDALDFIAALARVDTNSDRVIASLHMLALRGCDRRQVFAVLQHMRDVRGRLRADDGGQVTAVGSLGLADLHRYLGLCLAEMKRTEARRRAGGGAMRRGWKESSDGVEEGHANEEKDGHEAHEEELMARVSSSAASSVGSSSSSSIGSLQGFDDEAQHSRDVFVDAGLRLIDEMRSLYAPPSAVQQETESGGSDARSSKSPTGTGAGGVEERMVLKHWRRAMVMCHEAERWELLVQLKDEMRQRGVDADALTYSLALNACAKLGDPRMAMRFFEELRSESNREQSPSGEDYAGPERRGVQINSFHYCSVIIACGDGLMVDEALKFFEAHEESWPHEDRPDAVRVPVFTAAIQACARAGRWRRAVEIFMELEALGARDEACKPNVVSFNAVLDAVAPFYAEVARLKELPHMLAQPSAAGDAVEGHDGPTGVGQRHQFGRFIWESALKREIYTLEHGRERFSETERAFRLDLHSMSNGSAEMAVRWWIARTAPSLVEMSQRGARLPTVCIITGAGKSRPDYQTRDLRSTIEELLIVLRIPMITALHSWRDNAKLVSGSAFRNAEHFHVEVAKIHSGALFIDAEALVLTALHDRETVKRWWEDPSGVEVASREVEVSAHGAAQG